MSLQLTVRAIVHAWQAYASAVGGSAMDATSEEERAFCALSAKMCSLAAQLCKGVPQHAALVIIGLLPTTVRAPSVVAYLMEAALQVRSPHSSP